MLECTMVLLIAQFLSPKLPCSKSTPFLCSFVFNLLWSIGGPHSSWPSCILLVSRFPSVQSIDCVLRHCCFVTAFSLSHACSIAVWSLAVVCHLPRNPYFVTFTFFCPTVRSLVVQICTYAGMQSMSLSGETSCLSGLCHFSI
jgi:hypothetical protein